MRELANPRAAVSRLPNEARLLPSRPLTSGARAQPLRAGGTVGLANGAARFPFQPIGASGP